MKSACSGRWIYRECLQAFPEELLCSTTTNKNKDAFNYVQVH